MIPPKVDPVKADFVGVKLILGLSMLRMGHLRLATRFSQQVHKHQCHVDGFAKLYAAVIECYPMFSHATLARAMALTYEHTLMWRKGTRVPGPIALQALRLMLRVNDPAFIRQLAGYPPIPRRKGQ